MYKVFINDKSLILTDKYDDYTSSYDSLFIRHSDNETLKITIELLMESPVLKSIYIFHENLADLWTGFNTHYDKIVAAGGVVQSKERVLFIFKNKHWDLPKGKLEKDESPEEGALREVKEECGISELNISELHDITYHTYKEGGKDHLKKTHWFKMNTPEEGPFEGDAKEGISQVNWLNAREWEDEKLKSYPSLIEVLSSIF